ncbi:hypothetical protein GCM10023169_17500 [Georgenia halophila]|uniref:Uncharacterized protein n=1 Tax=Georgenia halophila TaxID=620889 RepID=A0ABP8L5P5_9MICO
MSERPLLSLPASVTLALWLPAVDGPRTARQAARAVAGDEVHHVHERGPLPGGSETLHDVLTELTPVEEVGAILPRAGDPMGAPAVRSADLLDAGEGVLLRRPGKPSQRCSVLVPEREVYGSVLEPGEMVTWHVDHDVSEHLAAPSLLLAGVESLSHARRQIQLALSDTVEALEDLDVARDRPDLADQLLDLSLASLPAHVLPPNLDPRRLDVLERAARVLAIVELATGDDGAAVTAAQAGARAAALAQVSAAARHALAAASATRQAV